MFVLFENMILLGEKSSKKRMIEKVKECFRKLSIRRSDPQLFQRTRMECASFSAYPISLKKVCHIHLNTKEMQHYPA